MVLRRVAVLAILLGLMGVAAPARAERTYHLPAQVVFVTYTSGATPTDPQRCAVGMFAEFPKIPHAKSYEIVVRFPEQGGRTQQYLAPPFEDSQWTRLWPAPRGFARFFLGAYSTPKGCPDGLAQMAGNAEIVSSRVSLDRVFTKRFKKVDKPPYKCAYDEREKHVKLRGASGLLLGGEHRMIVVRRQGVVHSIEKGSNQPVAILTNRYAGPGTIIKTGPDSIVKIGALGGEAVLMGPNTTVRLTKSGFTVLKTPKHGIYRVAKRPPNKYQVRTCNAVLSARG